MFCLSQPAAPTVLLLLPLIYRRPSYDDLSVPAAALSDAHAAAEADWEWWMPEDAVKDGRLGFTKLSDEVRCCNTI